MAARWGQTATARYGNLTHDIGATHGDESGDFEGTLLLKLAGREGVLQALIARIKLELHFVLQDFVDDAKKRPGEILYASIGPASPSHLTAELFNSMAGIKTTHVPYKGAAPSMVALVSGETQLTFTTVLVAMPHVKSGRLRALGVASLKRSAVLPDVPTIDEAGVRGYESNAWYGLLAPAKTSPPIIDQLHRETIKALQLADVSDNLKGQGAEPIGNTPREFAAIIADEIEKWRKVVQATGARAE